MPFSSLPTELVRQIIESTVPSTFHSTTYRDRRSTLRSLCLVSRQFCSIAQPLLFEIIWIKSLKELDNTFEALDTQQGCRKMMQTVIYEVEDEPALEGLKKLATCCLGLVNLCTDLTLEAKLDFGIFQSFKNLRSLQIACNNIVSHSPIVLPQLESLALDGIRTDAVGKILRPVVLPSLRYLAIEFLDVDRFAPSTMKGLNDLVPQLYALFVDGGTLKHAPNRWFLPLDCTLFMVDSEDLPNVERFRDIHHIQITDGSSLLPRLASHITTNGIIRLKSIYLDSSLDPAASPTAEETALSEELHRACSEKEITIIYEKQGSEWIDPWFSEDFCRRQKELRQKVRRS